MISSLNFSTDKVNNPKMLSPLTLAYIGDTVYDLFVREALILEANRPANILHKLSAKRVCASAQAYAAQTLIDREILTEEEVSVLKRGRNAHSNHIPKNASERDYHLATGLEALFGFLYLSGNNDRLRVLFTLITDILNEKLSCAECK